MFELRDLMKKTEGILEKDGLKLNEGARIDKELRGRARSLIEHDMVSSIGFAPLNRLQDVKSAKPWQGKESDAEIAFNFERLSQAQDLYDFVINTGMLEHGEVRLVTMGDQHSVHFGPHVMVIKPDVIQAVMIANREIIHMDSVDDYNKVAEDITTVLHGRKKAKKSTKDDPVEVSLECNEGASINIVSKYDTEGRCASKGDLCTRHWESVESVGGKLAGVIVKLEHRHDITKEDASDVIKAVQFLENIKGMVVEAQQDSQE